jgi:hypothetical protein
MAAVSTLAVRQFRRALGAFKSGNAYGLQPFCSPIRRHAMERAARRPELGERPIVYGICHLRPARGCRWRVPARRWESGGSGAAAIPHIRALRARCKEGRGGLRDQDNIEPSTMIKFPTVFNLREITLLILG